ncbi:MULTISPECIES: SDR family oxidoreductase [unclassified Blastococcus]
MTAQPSTWPLLGRRAVVTGAAAGIGRAIGRGLLDAGASVAFLDRREEVHAAADHPVAPGALTLGLVADVTDQAQLERAREEVHTRSGPVDLVVANAGVLLGGPFERSSAQEWAAVVDVNVGGALGTARVFVEDLLAAAARGRATDLVLMGSVAARGLFPAFSVYSAAAAATAQLSRTLRAELGERGVRVRHVEPGVTLTDLGAGITDPVARQRLASLRAAAQPLTAEDVARAVVYSTTLPPGTNLAEVVVVPTLHA